MSNLFDVDIQGPEASAMDGKPKLTLVVCNTEEQAKGNPGIEALSIGEKFQYIWELLSQEEHRHNLIKCGISGYEKSIMAGSMPEVVNPLDIAISYEGYTLCEYHYKALRDQMLAQAERSFAPVGTTLKLVRSKYEHEYRPEKIRKEPKLLLKLWQTLEATYGGQAGEDIAWQQVAEVLVYQFCLRGKKEVEHKAGRFILHLTAHLDAYDKKAGKNLWSYHALETFQRSFQALARFAVWCDDDKLQQDFLKLEERYNGTRFNEVVSREQMICGANQEVKIVVFHSGLEFRFTETMAKQLQRFLGLYGDLGGE